MPDLRRQPRTRYGGIQRLGKAGCARSLRSLRLPAVARLWFIPMKIGAGMTSFMKTVAYG
jgi:hypothetical protein